MILYSDEVYNVDKPGSVIRPNIPYREVSTEWEIFATIFFSFFNCMFYQVLGVPHSSSSTPTWGSVLPSIVETRDQNSRGCPLLFSSRNLIFLCLGDRNPIHPQSLGRCGPLQE